MSTRKVASSTMVVLVLTAASIAAASEPSDPMAPLVGERIRVLTTRRGDPNVAGSSSVASRVGVLHSYDGETLTISAKGLDAPVRVPRREVRRIDIARGRRSMAAPGAAIGALAGVLLGLQFARCDCDFGGASIVGYSLLYGAAGAGAGALIGTPFKGDKWERLRHQRQTGLRLTPMAGGVAVSFAVPFPRQVTADRRSAMRDGR